MKRVPSLPGFLISTSPASSTNEATRERELPDPPTRNNKGLESTRRTSRVVTRANISVDKPVFDEFAAQSMLEGKTLFAFTNEWLDAAAKVSSQGGRAKDLINLWRTNSIMKQVDTIALPSDFVDGLIAKMYTTDKEGVLKSFSDLGKELVGVLKIVSDSLEGLTDLVKDFTPFTPIKRFEIRQADNKTTEVDIVGVGKRIESTECCFEFLKAVLNGYGYEVSTHQLYPGTIRLTAVRRGAT